MLYSGSSLDVTLLIFPGEVKTLTMLTSAAAEWYFVWRTAIRQASPIRRLEMPRRSVEMQMHGDGERFRSSRELGASGSTWLRKDTFMGAESFEQERIRSARREHQRFFRSHCVIELQESSETGSSLHELKTLARRWLRRSPCA